MEYSLRPVLSEMASGVPGMVSVQLEDVKAEHQRQMVCPRVVFSPLSGFVLDV